MEVQVATEIVLRMEVSGNVSNNCTHSGRNVQLPKDSMDIQILQRRHLVTNSTQKKTKNAPIYWGHTPRNILGPYDSNKVVTSPTAMLVLLMVEN
jgi:hypothetical protein